MTESANKVAATGLTPADRDRLFREWILPHLSLTPEHAAFLQEVLKLRNPQGYYSHPGTVSVTLDELAPRDSLAALPCCVIRGSTMSLAGPKDGGLLFPMRDPQGHFTAFQIVANRQLDAGRTGQRGAVRWWQASGSAKPVLANGELPLQVGKADDDLTIVLQTLAGADFIAGNWGKTAISTTEEQLSLETLNQYLTELQPKAVGFLIERSPSRNACQRLWEACNRLQSSGWMVQIVVPVLSDEMPPERFGSCTTLSVERWVEGLPVSTQNLLLGREATHELSEFLKRRNQEMHLSATAKIRIAYDGLKDTQGELSINSLAQAAGVGWHTVHSWLDEQGIGDTAKLRTSIEAGWEPRPPTEPELPALVVSKADQPKAATPAEPEPLPLFEFAEQEQKRTDAPASVGGTEVITAELTSSEVLPGDPAPPASETDTDSEPPLKPTPAEEIVVEALPVDPVPEERIAEAVRVTEPEPEPPPEEPKPDSGKTTNKSRPPTAEPEPPPRQVIIRPGVAAAIAIGLVILVIVLAYALGPGSIPVRSEDLPSEQEVEQLLPKEKFPTYPNSTLPLKTLSDNSIKPVPEEEIRGAEVPIPEDIPNR